ncbi:MAG: hypothetical protein MSH48_03595 [Mollicutes bacterium]|nr:hypothetical protein [Mollicutes bacterium]
MNVDEQRVIKEMIEIYKPNGYDWMGNRISKKNVLTFHHIVKRKIGRTIKENGALLTQKSHQRLNKLETHNQDLFERWQWLFIRINCSGMPPSVELISEIQALKEETNNFIYGKQSQLKLTKK